MSNDDLLNITNPLTPENLPQLIADRTAQVQRLVDDFITFYNQKHSVQVVAIDDVAAKLASAYYAMVYKHVKPAIEMYVNRYKMGSLLELIIVNKQVLNIPDATERTNRQLNALFGMNAALSLIGCMIDEVGKEAFFNTSNATINAAGDKFLKDHELWLETKDLYEFPIFINAQYYELVETLRCCNFLTHGF